MPSRPLSPPSPKLNCGYDRGQYTEDKAYRAIVSRRALWPKYIWGVRRATSHEDSRGFDLIAILTNEHGVRIRLGIQIKSSVRSAQRFRSSHPDIPVIVGLHKDAEIFLRFMDIAKKAYHNHLERKEDKSK